LLPAADGADLGVVGGANGFGLSRRHGVGGIVMVTPHWAAVIVTMTGGDGR
jgi:hypothetical protein